MVSGHKYKIKYLTQDGANILPHFYLLEDYYTLEYNNRNSVYLSVF